MCRISSSLARLLLSPRQTQQRISFRVLIGGLVNGVED